MTVKAIYEDGVFKPKEPVALEDHAEVDLEITTTSRPDRSNEDPGSFVGFIKGGVKGMPIAAHHDRFMDQDQYAHLKAYLRPLVTSPEWKGLSQEQRLNRFIQACKRSRPDFKDLWDDMDRIPLVWSNAFEYCARAIEREALVSQG
jgi:predicted DNA-binding antitoxin AbrB/MazE fold protein